MRSIFDIGDVVAATKALRQDGTFPDTSVAIGQILVDEGTRGEVLDVGLYLQEHIVYAVAFENGRVVGALERELVPADRAAPGPGDSADRDVTPAGGIAEHGTAAPGDAVEGEKEGLS